VSSETSLLMHASRNAQTVHIVQVLLHKTLYIFEIVPSSSRGMDL
jgi:hypothetical protein